MRTQKNEGCVGRVNKLQCFDKMPKPRQPKKSRAEVFEFDGEIVAREGVNVCPFGDGLVCSTPGCMVCAGGARCCSPGDTCLLEDGSENWCTKFSGTNTVAPRGGEMSAVKTGRGMFAPDARSFWEV